MSNHVVSRHVVVIVGGSFAGLRCALALNDTRIHVILIEQKDYLEYTPAVLRCMVYPSHIPSMILPLSQCRSLSHVTIIHARVTCFDEKYVVTQNGDKIMYDTLVLATGTGYANAIRPSFFGTSAITHQARVQELEYMSQQVSNATSITIIGGGVVAVELAAEVAHYHPTKKCTLCIRPGRLLPEFHPSAHAYTMKFMEKHGVIIKEQNIQPSEYKATDGELVFDCTGQIVNPLPNSELMLSSNPTSTPTSSTTSPSTVSPSLPRLIDVTSHIDSTGHLLVDRYCRLSDHPYIFVIGDVMSHPVKQSRTAYAAELAGLSCSSNIIRILDGKDLSPYPESISSTSIPPFMICCSLGPRDGFIQFNETVTTGYTASFSKWSIEQFQIRLYRGDITGSIWNWMIEPSALMMNRGYRWLWNKQNDTIQTEMKSMSGTTETDNDPDMTDNNHESVSTTSSSNKPADDSSFLSRWLPWR